MPEKEIRRLSAVMFTDIAGYTAMVQSDEAGALKHVARYRSVLEEKTAKYNGKVISYYGDGSLSIYDSAMEAVHCAIEMQQAYQANPAVPVRAGIHLGDIVFKDDTIYGDGVNVASRIESQGIPGSVLISDKIRREVHNHPEIRTKKLGAYNLKNVQGRTIIYALANEGLVVPRQKAPDVVSRKNVIGAAVGLLLLFLIGYFVLNSGLIVLSGSKASEAREERVAVFFDSAFLPDSLQIVPEMAGRLLVDALIDVPNAKVTSYESVLRQIERQKSGDGVLKAGLSRDSYEALAANTGAVNLLNGFIIYSDDSLEFRAHLENLINGDIIHRFPIRKYPANRAQRAIESLGSDILGWWVSKEDNTLSAPNYEAYEAYLEAKSNWRSNDSIAETLLKKSIRLDPDFLDPYFLLMELYYNNGHEEKIEAYVDMVKQRFNDLTTRQQRVLDYHIADVEGRRVRAFELFLAELYIDPTDLFVNTSAMVMADIYINSPDSVIKFFEYIPVDSLDMEQCDYCATRVRVAARAYLELGDERRTRDLLTKLPMDSRRNLVTAVAIYASLLDTHSINRILESASLQTGVDAAELAFEAAYHFKLAGRPDLTENYAAIPLSAYKKPKHGTRIRTQILVGQLDSARAVLEDWRTDYPDNQFILSNLGLIYGKLGERNKAEEIIGQLRATKDPFDYGFSEYSIALIRVQLEDINKGMEALVKAHQEGMRFYDHYFDMDVELIPIHQNEKFLDLIHPMT